MGEIIIIQIIRNWFDVLKNFFSDIVLMFARRENIFFI